mmetsp:Transcript_64037/g.176914  ORF Transcript_64037/g.176914 Transcript_64037/m.176914 type:complete len:231 (-) Transcript_64037:406-1098(-)
MAATPGAKKILILSTSAGAMGGNPTGLWLAELAEPYYLFKEAGIEMTIASPTGGAIPIDAGSLKGDFFTAESKQFMHDADALDALFHSKAIADVSVDDFDGLYVAGGHGCCVDGGAMAPLVSAFYNAGKLTAADCHGPYCLIDAKKADGTPLVAGLEVTAFTNLEEEQAGATAWVQSNALFMETVFKEQGATFNAGDPWSSNVVTSGNLVTAQNPQSATAAANKCIEMLA